MTKFETIKTAVSLRQAAEHYGLPVGRSGMCRCPFHDDHTPSLKLNEDYYYCFGCGATGDVIDFTARLFGLRNGEAAQKLAVDFGISRGKPSVLAKLRRCQQQGQDERRCIRVLTDYLHTLQEWKQLYSPTTPEDEPDPRYVEACNMLDCVEYMTDLLLQGSPEELAALVADMRKDDKITMIEERVKAYREESDGRDDRKM
jgi:hypothetical protein